MRNIGRLFAFLSMTLGLGFPVLAQTSSGQISGRIIDPSGAAVPDAAITLTNQATAEVRTTKSESSGEFVFPAVQPGIFTVAVSAPGFKQYEKRSLTLHASERLAAGNLQLEIGAVNESINVQAEQTPVQTDSSERSSVVDAKELSTLMASNRDITQLLRVMPGVVKDSSPGGQFGGSQNAGNVNGVRGDYNSLSVDGTTGNTRGGPNLDTPANYDSVGEVKVLLNNYQAEYGQAAGAIVEIVTKSGTRDFHGSVYYYNRNEAYNANSYFNKRTNPVTPRPVSRFNTIGYNIGGPLFIPHVFNTRKDKMFFFWSQEIWPSTTPGSLKYWMMPTALEKQGNFSASVDKNGKPVFLGNLDGLMQLASLGQPLGLDLWNFRTEGGKSIRAALDFLLPYALGNKKWDYQQISGFHNDALLHQLQRASAVYRDAKYAAAVRQLEAGKDDDLQAILLNQN